VKVLAYSSQSKWIASGGFDKKIKIWDIAEGRPKEKHGGNIFDFIISFV